jgi:hypothetical protein
VTGATLRDSGCLLGMQTAMSNARGPMRAARGHGELGLDLGHGPRAPGPHAGCIVRAGDEKIGEDRP